MRLLTFIALVLIGFSCERKRVVIEQPAQLIPQDSFVLILTDLLVLESHIQGKYVQLNAYAEIMSQSGDSLMKKYNINYDRFKQSVLYYGQLPQRMDSIYTEVIDTLNIRMINIPD
jgi:hypothetical protein